MKTKTVMHLSLCRKAGKLKSGFDAVREGMGKGQIFATALAADLSEKTKANIAFAAAHAQTPVPVSYLPDTLDEIATVAGRRTGVLGITDRSLAQQLCKLCPPSQLGYRRDQIEEETHYDE